MSNLSPGRVGDGSAVWEGREAGSGTTSTLPLRGSLRVDDLDLRTLIGGDSCRAPETWSISSEGESSEGEIQHSLVLISQNVGSAARHENLIADISADIVCVQETRLSEKTQGPWARRMRRKGWCSVFG